jgi:hypothetical protein
MPNQTIFVGDKADKSKKLQLLISEIFSRIIHSKNNTSSPFALDYLSITALFMAQAIFYGDM